MIEFHIVLLNTLIHSMTKTRAVIAPRALGLSTIAGCLGFPGSSSLPYQSKISNIIIHVVFKGMCLLILALVVILELSTFSYGSSFGSFEIIVRYSFSLGQLIPSFKCSAALYLLLIV